MTSHRSKQFHTHRRNNNNCRFCKENGHTVKECTVLANNECKYCHNCGHTTRRCPKLAEKEDNRRNLARAARNAEFAPDTNGYTKAKGTFSRRVSKGPRVMGTVTMGRFDALNSQEEVDTKRRESTINFSNNKPVLKGSWSKPFEVSETTDSTVKSTPQSTSSQSTPQSTTPQSTTPQSTSPQSTSPQSTTPGVKKINTARWADMADTDSDSEDEDFSKYDLRKKKKVKKF
jgi:hypothetical protein